MYRNLEVGSSAKMNNKMYTIKEWVKTYGKKYQISSEQYVRRCLNGAIDGRINKPAKKLPTPWKSKKLGEQWFIYKEDFESDKDLFSKIRGSLADYKNAMISENLLQSIITTAKEAAINKKILRLVLEFHPDSIESIWVDKVFDKDGLEILAKSHSQPDKNELITAEWMHVHAHYLWLREHLFNLSDSEIESWIDNEFRRINKNLNSKFSEKDLDEIKRRLRKHCLNCGIEKPPGKRPQAKFCSEDECGKKFAYWKKRCSKLSDFEKLEESEKRLSQIRPALSNLA